VPERGLRDAPDHLVTDGCVERERPLEIGHTKAEVQGPHRPPSLVRSGGDIIVVVESVGQQGQSQPRALVTSECRALAFCESVWFVASWRIAGAATGWSPSWVWQPARSSPNVRWAGA